jgi:hypothetical protein
VEGERQKSVEVIFGVNLLLRNSDSATYLVLVLAGDLLENRGHLAAGAAAIRVKVNAIYGKGERMQ